MNILNVNTQVMQSLLDIQKWTQQIRRVTEKELCQLKTLMDAIGVRWVQAEGEADYMCAALYHQGDVEGCFSNDSDLLVAGVGTLVTRLSTSSSLIGASEVVEYNLKTTLSALKLTSAQLVDMSILMGCDYNANLSQVGPGTAYAYICEHGTLEDVLWWKCDLEQRHDRPSPDKFTYAASREQFNSWRKIVIPQQGHCKSTKSLATCLHWGNTFNMKTALALAVKWQHVIART